MSSFILDVIRYMKSIMERSLTITFVPYISSYFYVYYCWLQYCEINLRNCCAVSDMGVKDLWTILEPVKQHKRLTELQGQVIAIDLSIWIVEAKTLQLKGVTKPHLRFIKHCHYHRLLMSVFGTCGMGNLTNIHFFGKVL